MKPRLSSWLPALATAALLIAALLAPARGVRARSGPRADAVFNPSCSLVLQQGGAQTTFDIATSMGVCQPLAVTSNAAACTLGLVQPNFSYGRLDIVAWDSNALAPDPNVVALRSRFFNNSALIYSHLALYFDPPLIGRSVPGVAEPPPAHLAIDYRVESYTPGQTVYYEPDGSPDVPAALSFTSSPFIPRAPLPGTHPVLSHRVCGGDASLQNLYVVQSVMTSNTSIGGTALYEIAQRFRVPVATRLHWVEFPLGESPYTIPYEMGVIKILDAQGQSTPPVTLPTPMIQAQFYGPQGIVPSWQSHYDLDEFITLQAEHDYWLVMTTSGDYTTRGRLRTGTESPYFTERIGPLVSRNGVGQSWSAPRPENLNFRIVGEPLAAVSVAQAAAPNVLRLAISPRPARGAVQVAWSGARGALRFEVMDARGRRVAGGESAAGRDGQWTWNAASEGGAMLPAGVYFVRARDASGRTASERVVLVR